MCSRTVGKQGLATIWELATPAACASAAAVASAACFSPLTEAHCSVLDRNLGNDAFDADAATEVIERIPDWSSFGSAEEALKVYRTQPKTVSSVFVWQNLVFTAVRSLLLNVMPIMHLYFSKVEELEEDRFAKGLEPLEEWPPWPWEDMDPALRRSLWMALRDLATLTVRRLYEQQAYQTCDLQIAYVLIRDVREGISELFALTFYYRVPRVASLWVRAQALGAAADCTVSIVIDSYRHIYKPVREQQLQAGPQRLVQRFGRICAANTFRCSTCLVVGSAGAALGAWLLSYWPIRRPYLGAMAGATASEFAFSMFVVMPLVGPWAYGLDASGDGSADDQVPDAADRSLNLPGFVGRM